jgi:hypothetical protein
MKTKKYPFTTFTKEPEGDIIYVKYIENLKVDLDIAKELVANRLDFTENKPHYLIIDVSNVKQITAEAKKYMQSPTMGLKNILATAFIASNHVSALIANIFVKTPNVISKFFSSEKDALLWIKGLKRKNISS